jgi:hypothetical protein
MTPHPSLLPPPTGKRPLVSVLARQSNTGFTYFAPDGRVLTNSGPPILLEPVRAADRPDAPRGRQPVHTRRVAGQGRLVS